MQTYSVICYRGNASTAQVVVILARSSADAFARLGGLGYTPAHLISVQ